MITCAGHDGRHFVVHCEWEVAGDRSAELPGTASTRLSAPDRVTVASDAGSDEEKKRPGTKLSNKTLLQRRKDGGFIVPYKVTDNPHLLAPSDWNQVVAVFPTGPTRQWPGLYGMPCNRNPAKLFSKTIDDRSRPEKLSTQHSFVLSLLLTVSQVTGAGILGFPETQSVGLLKTPHNDDGIPVDSFTT
ncbi:accessory factor associated with RNA polymerase II [Homalodisca vitripennis]|nr:accessory factor associated with RNA polymerase II [Homalodisca vitripennis]